jgi:hypothetical protein
MIMGSSRWSADDWTSYSSSASTKTTKDIFKSTTVMDDMNPLNIKLRESRDSDLNPLSTPIIVGLDVTGSMGTIAELLARKGLGIMVEEILKRKPVSDPHIMCMAVGDAYHDSYPLQVTQFEADIKIAEQLEKLWLEKGGGGNNFESYNLPWYFAATRTSIDSFEKRNKKGYLFTIGDEEAPEKILKGQIKRIFGDDVQSDYTSEQLLNMVSRMYNVFHIVIEQGSYAQRSINSVMNSWNSLLGQRVIRLSDYNKLAEVIVSTIQVNEGTDIDKVVSSWSGSTSVVVSRAVGELTTKKSNSKGVVKFD